MHYQIYKQELPRRKYPEKYQQIYLDELDAALVRAKLASRHTAEKLFLNKRG